MKNIVYNMDCMKGMAQIPDKWFDWVIADPPYFKGPDQRKYYGKEVSTYGVKRINYRPIKTAWNVPDERYFKEIERVSHNQIVWGMNYYDYNFASSGVIVWDKVNGQSSFSDAELAHVSSIDSVRIFRYMWSGMRQGRGAGDDMMMQGDKSKNEKKIHQTQKPIMLYKWQLERFCKPGDKILDTHVGSGSSRIAADEYGFYFIGFELDKGVYADQEARYVTHKSQQTLF